MEFFFDKQLFSVHARIHQFLLDFIKYALPLLSLTKQDKYNTMASLKVCLQTNANFNVAN